MANKDSRALERVANLIGNAITIQAAIGATVVALIGGFAESIWDFPWYWRTLFLVAVTVLVLALIVRLGRLFKERKARREQEAQAVETAERVVGVKVDRSQMVSVGRVSVHTGSASRQVAPRTPIRLDPEGMARLEQELRETSLGVLALDAKERRERREIDMRYGYVASDDEQTRRVKWDARMNEETAVSDRIEAEFDAEFGGRLRALSLLAADNGFVDGQLFSLLEYQQWSRDDIGQRLRSLAEQIRLSGQGEVVGEDA